MERRNFIKSTCQLCLLGVAGLALPQMLSSCNTTKSSVYKTAIDKNKVSIPLALFAESTVQLVRPEGWYYDIAVEKHEDGTYAALLMKCTHMDNQLDVSSSGFSCSMHGSLFDKDGQVKKGPAERPLKHYRTETQEGNLIIYIS